MLKIYIISPFPNLLNSILDESMLRKAVERNKVEYNIINLFDFLDNHERIDDYPYGGGKGMIMKAEPIFNAVESIDASINKVIYPSPDGKLFNQSIASDYSKETSLVFICGHYKGIDQRVRDTIVTDEISIGDFVLTNGELPTLVILDAIIRLIPGVLNDYDSAKTDSFFDELLDGPYYTRPKKFREMEVPDILTSGNHSKIEEWFLEKKISKTKKRRKDLYEKYKSKYNGDENE